MQFVWPDLISCSSIVAWQAGADKPSVQWELKCLFVFERGNSITGVLHHGARLALMKCSLGVNSILIFALPGEKPPLGF